MSAAVCVRVDDGGTRESTQRPGTDRARATVLTSVHFRRGQTQRRRRRQPDAADGRRAASLPGTDLLPTRPSSPSLTNDPALRHESSLPSCCPTGHYCALVSLAPSTKSPSESGDEEILQKVPTRHGGSDQHRTVVSR